MTVGLQNPETLDCQRAWRENSSADRPLAVSEMPFSSLEFNPEMAGTGKSRPEQKIGVITDDRDILRWWKSARSRGEEGLNCNVENCNSFW